MQNQLKHFSQHRVSREINSFSNSVKIHKLLRNPYCLVHGPLVFGRFDEQLPQAESVYHLRPQLHTLGPNPVRNGEKILFTAARVRIEIYTFVINSVGKPPL